MSEENGLHNCQYFFAQLDPGILYILIQDHFTFEALSGVLGKRGIRPFISGEQGNKSLKLKKTGKQRQTENIENQDFDL